MCRVAPSLLLRAPHGYAACSFDYRKLALLNANPSMGAHELLGALATGFMNHPGPPQNPRTITVVNMSRVDDFRDAVERFSSLMLGSMILPRVTAAWSSAISKAMRMGDEFVDFGHFLKILKNDSRLLDSSSDLATTIAAVQGAYFAMILQEAHSNDVPGAETPSIYVGEPLADSRLSHG